MAQFTWKLDCEGFVRHKIDADHTEFSSQAPLSNTAATLANHLVRKGEMDAAITSSDELGELTDVTLDAPEDGQLLIYNQADGQWVNGYASVTIPVHNNTASDIDKGTPVYVSGTHSSGKPTIDLADANGSTTYPAIGLAADDITAGSEGTVIVSGMLHGVDTQGLGAGSALYLSGTPGVMTTTRPTASGDQVQKVGLVTRDNQSAGEILVIGAGRVNDANNELITLTGVSRLSDDLGTFSGSIITDNTTIKAALQELETAVEAGGGGYHDRYATEAETTRSGATETVEVYYTARPDGDGLAESEVTTSTPAGFIIERKLYFSDKFNADPDTASDWTLYTTQPADNTAFATAKASLLAGLSDTDGTANTRGTLPVSLKMTHRFSQDLLLEDFPGAAAAYSLRRISTDYTGSAIRIREDGTNTETDIGFDADGNLDTNAIALFCGSNNGYVVTWYDQSGNSRDATAAADTNEPKIYDGTSGQITSNRRPAIQFDGTDDSLGLPNAAQPANINNCSAFTVQAPNNGGALELSATTVKWIQPFGWYIPTEYFGYGSANGAIGGYTVTQDAQRIITAIAGSTQGDCQVFSDGVSQGSTPLVSATPVAGEGRIGGSSTNSLEGYAQEIIIYHSDQSANRTDIENDISTYYAIGKPDGPLNVLTDADTPAAGYSLRKLTKFYYGPCIRIRRDNDNQETDIGFDSNDELNTADIISFCGANNGFVVTWYDQSGGGNDISQAAVGNQPEIYDGSNVYTSNSKPAVAFDQSSLPYLYTSVFTTSTTASVAIVCQHAVDATTRGIYENGSSNGHSLAVGASTDYYQWSYQGVAAYNASAGSAVANTQTLLFGRTISGSSHDLWKDGSSILSTTPGTMVTPSGSFWIGAINAVTPINGRVQEFILWDTDQSANRNKVEENTAAYFGITLPYLLNNYPGASAAYSLRKINDAYTGPAIRIREDGGNTETNIGFDSNGELNTADIESWCGSNNGYVVTWYDQSGNSNNVTQATTTRQPQVYNGSAVITRNGKPTILFSTVGTTVQGLEGTALSASNRSRTIFSVASLEVAGAAAKIAAGGLSSTYQYWSNIGGSRFVTSASRTSARYDAFTIVAETVGLQVVRTDIANTTNVQIYKNGTQVDSRTDNNADWSQTTWGLGGLPAIGGGGSNHTTSELIMYESDQSANRANIEADTLDHYKTTKPDGPFDLVSDTPAAGYSVRKLTKFYEGSCLRIRRDNDNEELDIGFDSNDELKIADISSFCGANNGFVVTWYDQSGNGNDLTQSDTAHQAKIYDGTTILTRNGKPCIRPNDGTDTYTASGLSTSQGDLTAFAVATHTYNGESVLFGENNVSSHFYLASLDNNFNNQYGISADGVALDNVVYYIDGEEQTWYSRDRDAVYESLFGQQRLIGIYNNGGPLNGLVLGYSTNNSVAQYEMQEFILYNSDQTANRNLINNNTAAYFGITLPQLLNNYSGAEAAYSLRRLSSSHTGAAIRIREDIGDTETDIGFDSNGDLDAAAIKSFCDAVGGANGYVVTWYDQSGNGQDATQSVAADQPQIYDGTAVIQSNGRPAIQFDGSTDGLEFSLSNAPTIVSLVLETSDDLFIPIGNSAFSPQSYLLIGQQGSTSTGWSTWRSASGNFVYVNSTTALSEGQTRGDVYNAISTGNQTLVFVEVDTAPTGTIQLGQWQQSAQHDYNGKMSEVVLWQTDHSTNRTVIEANAITYYGIGIDDGPLDIVTDSNAAAAYSVRKVTKFYNGPSLRVRRASDNYESNIGFDSNGDLDTAAIASFCSTSNGFVVAWYDQSGNKKHATQNSTVEQPQIYNGTSTLTENGKPTIDFDGSDDSLISALTVNTTDLAVSSVQRFDSLAGGQMGITISEASLNQLYLPYNNTANNWIFKYKAVDQNFTADTNQNLISFYTNGTSTYFYKNGATLGSALTASALVSSNGVRIGAFSNGSLNADINCQELIIWQSDQSSNRIDLEENTARYFGITLPYLLSNYPGAAAVYSLRKLNVRYTGSAIRIREDGGNTETDIGFDSNGNLNTAAIASWCGSNNGYVVTWYDQSGNNRNATAVADTNEPKIYDGGTGVHTTNGKPAIQFDGTDDYLNLPNAAQPANINNCSAFTVQANTTGFGFTLGTSSNGVRWYQTYVTGGNEYFGYDGSAVAINLGTASTKQKLITAIAGSTQGNAQAFVDGVSKGTYTLTSGVPAAADGKISFPGQYATGDFQEIIVYHSDQSTNRTGIESDISAYWTANKLLLDSYPGPEAAYSVRKINNDYTGYCMRVRNVNNNSTSDIGFDSNGDLDVSAIETLCGAYNGAVEIWYDQSGGGHHQIQETTTLQPFIYLGSVGEVLKENNRPVIIFTDGGQLQNVAHSTVTVNLMDTFGSASPTPGYTFAVVGPGGDFSTYSNFVIGTTSGGGSYYGFCTDSGTGTLSPNFTADFHVNKTLQVSPTRTSLYYAIDPQAVVTADWTAGVVGPLRWYINYNFAFAGSLQVQEYAIYYSDKSSDQSAIEDAMETYYQPTTSFLGQFSGAAAAYSVRCLTAGSSTARCMKVRRDSDNATQDIGFDSNGDLDTAAIATFCGSANGYVDTWYDQSGNGNHATQATTTRQPQIYDGSQVLTKNGRPALDGNGSSYLDTGRNYAATFSSYVAVHAPSDATGNLYSGTNERGLLTVVNFASVYRVQIFSGVALLYQPSGAAPSHNLISAVHNGTSSSIHHQGSLVASGNSGTDTVTNMGLFARSSSFNYTTCSIHEVILYESDHSANRTGVESDIDTYYGVSTQLLLDTYSGAAAAYSVRKLSQWYTGNCMKVRRDSDGQTQDIGFDSNGDLDTAAIKTFCDAGGAGTLGYVHTWYDQSGSGRHLSQTGDDAKQPQIYDGTAVITANGKPALDPRSGAARLYSASTTISPTMTIMLVKSGHGGDFGAPLWYDTGNATLVWDRNSVGAPGPYYGIDTAIHYATPPTDAIYTMKYGSDSATRSNGSEVATTTGNTVNNMSRVVLGGRYEAATGAWSGKAHELVIWDTDYYSASAADLESNANTYFGIF